MRSSLRRIFVILIAIGGLAISVSVRAQSDANSPAALTNVGSETLGKTFFVSRVTHANGETSIDPIGSLLLWTLMTMSAINLGLIGYLAFANQRKTIFPEGVATEMKRLLNNGDYRAALQLTQTDQSFFSQVVHAGLTQASQGVTAVVRALEQTADLKITVRMRPIEILYMFGQVSPMMGLLGTVYGIIYAFRVFVSMGGHASPALLAGGIGTALVATFWGLVVAIPALAGYSVLRNKVDHLTMEATAAAEELIVQFKPKAAAVPAPKPTAAAKSVN